MVDKQQFFLPCFVVCAIFSAIITAQSQVDTDPREILVTEGQRNVSLLCRLGRPIQFCTIAFPNSKQISLKPGDPQRNGLTYFGAGLEAGACGVTIDRITTAHNGALKCTLFSDESYEGFINVVVAVAPKAPHIQLVKPSSAASFEVDTDMEAHCDAEFGNPAAELFWFLDDEPIYEGVSQPEYREEEQGYSSYVSLRHRIRASDSGKRLICRAKHVAYPEGMSETSLQITVNYAPQALPETTVHSLTVGRTVDVTITIQSNPAPQVAWTVDGMTIEQGQEHERYAARVPERQENGGYNVTLTIAGLTLEDLHKRYHLRASNQIGSQDYTIQLSADQAAAVDESSGVGVGGIIGIVLAALIVLVAIALIIMARATGRWCFRGKASSTTTSNARIGESDTTDEPGAGQQLLPTTTTTTPAATTTTTVTVFNTPPTSNQAAPDLNGHHGRVYNETTLPILRPKNLRNPDVIPTHQQQHQRPSIDTSSVYSGGSSVYGDPNQVGLPVVDKNRWIPSQQRELLERQANLLMSGAGVRRKRETEIF